MYLPGAHTAVAFRDAVNAVMADVPAELRRSLTWDQGKEMACHTQITAATGMTECDDEPTPIDAVLCAQGRTSSLLPNGC